MSESNNNTPMRITQLQEATAYEDGMYYAVAKAGSGTKKISANITQKAIDDLKKTNVFNGIDSKKISGFYINSGNGKWTVNSDYSVLIMQVKPNDKISIIAGNQNTYYAFLKSDTITNNQSADFVEGVTTTTTLYATASILLTAPFDANYIYITLGTSTTNRTPSALTLNNLNLFENIYSNIMNVKNDSLNAINSVLTGNTYLYTADGTAHRAQFNIITGHIYKIESYGIAVNVNYSEEIGSTAYNLINSVGGSNKIKFATAEHDGNIIYIASQTGSVNVSITDVTFEYNLKKNIVIDQNGNGDFTTLRDGISYAIKTPHTNVFVRDGVYDLLTEFASEIAASKTEQYGILLDNDVHIVFSSGAKVKALYTGNDSNVTTWFAPFYVSMYNVGGFTLENLDIEVSATRYCVHDEYTGGTAIVNNHYKNCRMSMDNSNAPINYYPQCIGGGVAQNSYIDIEGCYFKSKRAETQDTPLVSYHNAASNANSLSYINVHDCYFDGAFGTYRSIYHGPSTNVSKSYLSGNSFGIEPEVRPMTAQSTVENFDNVSWNNEIRNQ